MGGGREALNMVGEMNASKNCISIHPDKLVEKCSILFYWFLKHLYYYHLAKIVMTFSRKKLFSWNQNIMQHYKRLVSQFQHIVFIIVQWINGLVKRAFCGCRLLSEFARPINTHCLWLCTIAVVCLRNWVGWRVKFLCENSLYLLETCH